MTSPIRGILPKNNHSVEWLSRADVVVEPRDDAPFRALAFKVATDPFVGQLTYFRVYSGKLLSGSYVFNVNKNQKERYDELFNQECKEIECPPYAPGAACFPHKAVCANNECQAIPEEI